MTTIHFLTNSRWLPVPNSSMLSATLAATLALAPAALAQDIGKLQEALEGIDALWRSDSAFSDASTPFNQRYDYQPVGIVMPNSAEQISTAIKAANAQNIPVAARGGGHSYAALGLGGQDDTLVIDMSNIADTTVDAQSNQASIGGGARLGDVALALNDAGRAIPHGSCSYVGVGG